MASMVTEYILLTVTMDGVAVSMVEEAISVTIRVMLSARRCLMARYIRCTTGHIALKRFWSKI